MSYKAQEYYAHLKSGQVKPVYLFAGDDSFQQEEALLALEKRLAVDSLNREVMYGGDTPVSTIILGMQTMPFIAEKRFMVVKEAHKLKASDADKLAEFMRIPVETTCLVLMWQDKMKKG